MMSKPKALRKQLQIHKNIKTYKVYKREGKLRGKETKKLLLFFKLNIIYFCVLT